MIGVFDCEILEHQAVTYNTMRSVLKCAEIAENAVPGQFVNVKVSAGTDPMLRRPFSVHSVNPEKGTFSLLYVMVGRGTALLSQMKTGQFISVIGPIGRGFDFGDIANSTHIVVAGGCGAAPMHFLCDKLCSTGICPNVIVLSGAGSKDAVLCEVEFRAHGVEVDISTDDGSYGYKGFVTELLAAKLKEIGDTSNVRVYSCGPHLMMKAVADISIAAKVQSCQVSLENNMACGFGVCQGCVTKIKGAAKGDNSGRDWHHERVCKDGPVFNAEDILWQ